MVTSEQRKQVGQLFVVGFHGTQVNHEIKTLIQNYGVGTVILFKRNIASASQLRRLCHDLQQLARDAGHRHPLLISIDQENGLVTRITPPIAAQQPGAMALAATRSLETTTQVANVTAETLANLGINVNYAPVGDVNSKPLNPVIGVRSPGDDPELVARFAAACAAGLRGGRPAAVVVIPCIKHFPGHGDTIVDSHVGLPVVDKSRAQLDALELIPFCRAAADGIEMVMTAHIALPQLTGSQTPATLSPEIIGILRDELRFEGVIVTDDLEMDGIRATYGSVEGALMAFRAGVDCVMVCHTYDVQTAAIDGVSAALDVGEISPQRIQESIDRLNALRAKFTFDNDEGDNSGNKADDALAEINARAAKIARKAYSDSVTVVRSEPGLLPVSKAATVLFVSPGPKVSCGGGGGAVNSGTDDTAAAAAAAAVAAAAAAAEPTRVPTVSSSFGDEIRARCDDTNKFEQIRYTEAPLAEDEWRKVDAADVVILATRNARETPYQRRLGLAIAARRADRPLISVATAAPYDFLDEPVVRNVVAVYEPTREAFRAAVDVIYGVGEPRGTLPVAGGGA